MQIFAPVVAGVLLGSAAQLEAAEPWPEIGKGLMPRVEDYSSMWWAEGFPGVVADAPWRRWVRTGYYAIALDTETMEIPHLGPVPAGTSYPECGAEGLASLEKADLALNLTVNGKSYRCTAGGKWSRFAGPRLIASGRFLQRADVTDLVFTGADGETLNAEGRFETAAWPDRLGLILAARPGVKRIVAGEGSFGRIGGGFGLDGANHFEIPHEAALDPEQFTLDFWVFVPTDYRVSKRTPPWLICKNFHEAAEGNFGIVIGGDGKPQARMNIGGGRDGQFEVASERSLKIEAWNHLAMSYDGKSLRLYLNGKSVGAREVGRKRTPGRAGLAFGRRQDNSGDGYRFRGVIDEVGFYGRALNAGEVRERFAKPGPARPGQGLVRKWSFREAGQASVDRLREEWRGGAMEIVLRNKRGELRKRVLMAAGEGRDPREWQEVALALDPVTFKAEPAAAVVTVRASEFPGGKARAVTHDAGRGWHRVDLDGIEPVVPGGDSRTQNDGIERIKLVLANPSEREEVARLLFAKGSRGIRQRIGSPITGVSAILRDADGNPTGIPVQLSKNWHNRPEGGVYSGQWFHGLTQVRLPAGATVELELTLAYGHWGGVAAASHAQLSLIGWGSNQRWDESALGSWGESICYEPDQIQGRCSVLDVRPVMVLSKGGGKKWSWTNNVGGGDFFRFFDPAGERIPHASMRAAYQRYGPCLTEVTYSGRIGRGIRHAETVSLGRTDDVVRGTYRLRMEVTEEAAFSRFVIFQVGADSYNPSRERKMAFGHLSGRIREWTTQWGGDKYRAEPLECLGLMPWVSLHEGGANPRQGELGAWANRGFVIRSWKARLGGKEASPWIAERGNAGRGFESSTIDLVPPPGVSRLLPGDFVEATIEHVVLPQFAKDYYGPNEALRKALAESGNTWRMMHREALGNDRRVEIDQGKLAGLFPDVRIRAEENKAEFTLAGGLGYVPVTITGLTSSRGFTLRIDGKAVDQGVHGKDFWQTDYDAGSGCWSQTYNIEATGGEARMIRFGAAQ